MSMDTSRGGTGAGGGRRGRGRERPPLTVLIVDGDAQRAQTLAEWLQPTCLVAIAPSARVAASVMGQRIPDLIVTDLDLPDMPGVEFIHRLAGGAATRHILRVVVSRRRGVLDKLDALRAGADEFIVWPCERDFFVLRIKLLSRFRRIL